MVNQTELWEKLKPMNSLEASIELTDAINQTAKEGITGVIVECGCYKGGSVAFMARMVVESGVPRALWAFDSFEGFPEPPPEDPCRRYHGKGVNRKSPTRFWQGWLTCIEEDVWESLRIAEVTDLSHIHIIKGWFKDTIPQHKEAIGPISILRIDGDLYESTLTPLKELYDQVQVGGWIYIHDYGRWWSCKLATHRWLESRGLDPNLGFHGEAVQRAWRKQ